MNNKLTDDVRDEIIRLITSVGPQEGYTAVAEAFYLASQALNRNALLDIKILASTTFKSQEPLGPEPTLEAMEALLAQLLPVKDDELN